MIDWDETENLFGRRDLKGLRPKVAVLCDICNFKGIKSIRSKSKIINNNMQLNWKCKKCIYSDPDYKKKQSDNMKKLWGNELYKRKQSKSSKKLFLDEKFRNKISKSMKKKWENKEFRNKMSEVNKNVYDNDHILKMKKLWSDPEYKKKMSDISKDNWKKNRRKIMIGLSNQSKVSSIQNILYSILDDLNIEYFREYNDKENDSEVIVGPYSFDCVIPINNKKLLIECQGDYWHSTKNFIRNDKAKATYIEKYHLDCEIKYLWEHEFKCKEKIIELIKYWTNKTKLELIDYSFNNVGVRECLAKDYKLLLSKYHYLPNAGRGGIAHGAYLGDELIAICVFSPLIRQNLPWDKKSTRELSRLCIHPRYQKKNFASWFVSRCIKALKPQYKTIISYCDTTFNHDGATYKACNFKLDGEVKPDYWYVSGDGWVMHKKTLYGHAVKMGMKENDYAKDNKYKKVFGDKKLRFVYQRYPNQS